MKKINLMLDPQTLNRVAPAKQTSTKKQPIYGTIANFSYRFKTIESSRIIGDSILKSLLGDRYGEEAQRIALRALHIYYFDQQKPTDKKIAIKPLSKEEARRAYNYYCAVELQRCIIAVEKKWKTTILADPDAFFAACVAKKPLKTAQVLELPGVLKKSFVRCEPEVEKLLEKLNLYR